MENLHAPFGLRKLLGEKRAATPFPTPLSSQKKEPACKPGSVGDSHSSGMHVTAHLMRPTRERCGRHHGSSIWSCSEWGLPCREVLPPARCALTAPFHPYLSPALPPAPSAVSFLWHFPSAHAAQALPGTLPCGARTFLPRRGAWRDCPAGSWKQATGFSPVGASFYSSSGGLDNR